MNERLPFEVEPWGLGLSGIDTERLGYRESILALSNGHIGWRGNLDEGEPRGVPGSYLNGVFEERPMPYAEEGYGYPQTGQSVINVPNGQILRLMVDDEPFDVREGTLSSHEQRLDFRTGTLQRDLEWTSPAGRTVRVTSTRLVSYAHRSVAAVRYVVEAVDAPLRVTVQSELVANESLPEVHDDPRVQEALASPLEPVEHHVLGTTATLLHRTRRSGQRIAVTMEHAVTRIRPTVQTGAWTVQTGASTVPTSASTTPTSAPTAPASGPPGPDDPAVTTEASADLARATIAASLEPGERLEIVKMVAHEYSDALAVEALRDRAEGAVAQAMREGWDGLVAGQRARLDDYWECADVEVEGAPRLQQAMRFALFQVFQAAVRLELRSVAGKGLTGAGYEGHTFWDFEAFVLPLLTATQPEAAEQALRWRHATLDHARERARLLRFAGATFAWRTIDGRESSGYWPASTAALHVNADVASAVLHYVRATGDRAFEREAGLEILVETARLWISVGRRDAAGGFHIDGVTGPDEYTAIVNDNVYTNVTARLNLEGAAAAARRHPDVASELEVTDEEIGGWVQAAGAMVVVTDDARAVHPQSAGFTELERWDFEGTPPEQYPLQEHFPYFDLYRKQVVKQADLVLALYTAHEAFTSEQKARDFAYYEALTVRDSSLSAVAQAVLAAEVGQLELAADYVAEAASIDLDDLQGDADAGLHIAALAGLWTAVVAGFGGMRESDAGLRFAPRLPAQLTRLSFGMRVEGRMLRVDVRADAASYRLSEGPPLRVRHFGDELVLEPGSTVSAATPPLAPPGPRPAQPSGRTPRSFDEALGERPLADDTEGSAA